MRQIGTLNDQSQANLLADYLVSQGIRAQADQDATGWAVWVRDENHIEEARAAFQHFLADPDDSAYCDAPAKARAIRQKEKKQRAEVSRRTVSMGQVWRQPMVRRAPLTMALIALSVIVFLFSGFGNQQLGATMRSLSFMDYQHVIDPNFDPDNRQDGVQDILPGGQIWRLFTPAVIHFSLLHLGFNLYMLYWLGGQIETRKGTLFLGILVLMTGVAGNIAQFAYSGPFFGGMSGVVYGLFGYIWLRHRFVPQDGLQVSEFFVFIMLLWLVLGFTGALASNIGNMAHLGGLLAGMAWALATRSQGESIR